MPRTVSFPRPSTHICPVCDEVLARIPCNSCGADLRRPEATDLLRIDRTLHDLAVERAGVVQRLLAGVSPPTAPPAPPQPTAGDPRKPARWSMAEILVGLGGLSLVAAVAVFAAVAWSDLAAWAQGALLLTATAAVVGTAVTLRHRGLMATAESLGVVGVALGLADVEVVRVAMDGAVSDRSVWTAGLIAVAGGSIVVGRRSGLRSMAGLGVLLGFLPAIVSMSGGRLSLVGFTLAAQCAAGIGVEAWLRRSAGIEGTDRTVARAASVGAMCSAAAAALVGLGVASDPSTSLERSSMVAVGVYLTLAAVAVGGATSAAWQRRTSAVVLSLGALAVVAAGWLSAPSDPSTLALIALTAAAVGIVASSLVHLDPDRPWRAPMDTMGVIVGLVSLVPLVAVAWAALGFVDIAVGWPEISPSDVAIEALAGETTVVVGDLPRAADLPVWLALGSLGVTAAAVGRGWGRMMASVALVLSCVTVPLALELSVGTTVAILGAAWAIGIALRLRRPANGWLTPPTAAVGGLLVLVAASTVPTTVVAIVAVVCGTGLVAHRALDADLPSAPTWTALPVVTAIVGIAVVAARVGVDGSGPALLAVGGAALASVVAPLVSQRFGARAAASVAAADAVVGAALVLGTLATRSIDAASVATVVLGVVAGVHALRPDRRELVGAVLGAAVVLTWLRLVAADITLLEAYTLPFAGALLLGGALVPRGDRSSWVRNGGGLFVALAPSATLAVFDGDLLRTVVVVIAAAAVVLWGAAVREQAPLVVGGSVLAVLAVRHLGPVAADVPRYLTFGVVGVALLATGATFERRRRDVRRAVDAFARLA